MPPGPRRRQIRGDLDTIVGKALKKDPAARYVSVTALGDDLRRSLRHEPIGARPDTLVYRARTFVRRHQVAVAAAVLLVAVLSASLYAVNRQRALAQRLHGRPAVGAAPGPRCSIAGAARRLEDQTAHRGHRAGISAAADGRRGGKPRNWRWRSVRLCAWRVQGVPISANLGQLEQSDQTLQKAEAVIDPCWFSAQIQPRSSARLRSRTIG